MEREEEGGRGGEQLVEREEDGGRGGEQMVEREEEGGRGGEQIGHRQKLLSAKIKHRQSKIQLNSA